MDLPRLIGVIHLPNLRLAVLRRDVDSVVGFVEREARIFEEAGFDGVIVENFNDMPFSKKVSEPEILGLIALALHVVRKNFNGFVGLNILRSSGVEAYRIAYAFKADFIRVNAYIETLATDSGLIESLAPSLAELRLLMPGVKIFGDIFCKHSGSIDLLTRIYTRFAHTLGEESLNNIVKDVVKEIVLDACERGLADAIIVTGGRTGEPPPLQLVQFVKEVSPKPVYLGSGATPENIVNYIKFCNGVIIGSYVKINGRAGNTTDLEEAKRFAKTFREALKNTSQ
jgi:membrane complex biogenesis BtpA family protein